MMNKPTAEAAGLARFFIGEPEAGLDGFHRVVVSLEKPDGQRIRGMLTLPRGEWRSTIVVLSGLGRTIRHSGALALAAGHHGYATIRFDPTNHVGDSDGEMLDATMSRIVEDLLFVCNSVRRSGLPGGLFVVAASTFARCAVRALKYGLPVDGMVLTLPVVDFAKSIAASTGDDLVAAYRENRLHPSDPVQILSHQISARFLADAIEHEFCDLETTCMELSQSDLPVAAIAAEGDEWVALEDVAAALAPSRSPRNLYVLENADHDSYSFGFIRAVTQTTMQVFAEMTGAEFESYYEVTFAKLSNAVKSEKNILSRARLIWGVDDE